MDPKKYKPLMIAFFVTIVRYYDYSIFGLSASLLSKKFMPGNESSNKMLIFYAVFGLAAIAKPLGSLILGRIGDNSGRAASLKISMIIAAASTFLVAFVPPYSDIGFFAVILITLLRMTFLMSLAGEIDAIKIYVAEMVGKNNRHTVIGIVSFSSQIGVLIASFAYSVASSYPEVEWLWKINFVIGGALGFIIIFMRGSLPESPEFLSSKLLRSSGANNIVKIISINKVKFLLATVINGFLGGGYNFLIIFLISFVADIANIVDHEKAISANSLFIVIYSLTCIFSGYFADKFKIIYQPVIALALSIACVVTTISIGYSLMLHCFIISLVPFYTVPCYIRIQSLFPANIRMRMCSLSHSVGSMILSSGTPFVSMLIWQSTKNVSLVLSYFLLQLILLFFALLYMIKKGYNNMFDTAN